VDLTTAGEDVTGKLAENALDEVGITVNKNTIPGEKRSPFVTSGIRVGSAAMTTRGFNEAEAERIGELIGETVTHLGDESVMAQVKAEVKELLAAHPLYPELG
jgi:glycine hydroxymethyltransferase